LAICLKLYRHTLGGPWIEQANGEKSPVFRRGKSGNPKYTTQVTRIITQSNNSLQKHGENSTQQDCILLQCVHLKFIEQAKEPFLSKINTGHQLNIISALCEILLTTRMLQKCLIKNYNTVTIRITLYMKKAFTSDAEMDFMTNNHEQFMVTVMVLR